MCAQLVDGGLVPAYVREAVRRAEEERPGASHIELPEDVARQQARHAWLFRVLGVFRVFRVAWATPGALFMLGVVLSAAARGARVRTPYDSTLLACGGQVPDEECVVYPAERVRRPVPEIKAVAKAVEMIRARSPAFLPLFAPCFVWFCGPAVRSLACQQAG